MANNNPFLQPILKQYLGAAYTADEAKRILNLLRSPNVTTRKAENILQSILGGRYTEQEAQQILKYMYPEGTQSMPLLQGLLGSTFTTDEAKKILGLLTNGE